jgi:hypothetical protein
VVSKNDVTGDSLSTKPTTEKFRKGYEGIDWSVKLNTDEAPVDTPKISSDQPLESTKDN